MIHHYNVPVPECALMTKTLNLVPIKQLCQHKTETSHRNGNALDASETLSETTASCSSHEKETAFWQDQYNGACMVGYMC